MSLNPFFRDFYIFGESYGGKYVPSLSHRIHKSKTDPDNFGGAVDINLVGLGEFFITTVQVLKSKKLKLIPNSEPFGLPVKTFLILKTNLFHARKKYCQFKQKEQSLG